MARLIVLRDLFLVYATALLLTLSGCSGGEGRPPSTPDAGKQDVLFKTDGGGPPDKKAIIGRVVDPEGKGVEGATVTTVGGGVGTTDRDGTYTMANGAAAERMVLTFKATGYVGTTGVGKMTADGKITVNAVMRVRAAG